MTPNGDDSAELQAFIVELGAAMNSAGEPVHVVQERLRNVARAYGARMARITAFPTFLMVSMGREKPAVLEVTQPLALIPHLDQISAFDELVVQAERGEVEPIEGLRRLWVIHEYRHRFGTLLSIVGYAVMSLGLCLILHPAARDAGAAAVLGAFVGFLRAIWRKQPAFEAALPLTAAFSVAALSAFGVKHGLTGPGLRSMVAALVVFLPGAALTNAVLELAAGQMVSGASRLVSGIVQLALLSFGILAGIELVGVERSAVFSDSAELLPGWAPWLGVLVFGVGVTLAHSAPLRAFPTLLVVLFAAWSGQVVGNAIFGGYVSAFVGAAVMTAVAYWVSQLPSAMPAHASFLPGFWLLVPGALGLIGLTSFAGDPASTGAQDLLATTVSIFAVAIGVLCGTLILEGGEATERAVATMAKSVRENTGKLRRFRR